MQIVPPLKVFRYTLILILLLLGWVQCLRAQNLIANPSFESGLSDWHNFIPQSAEADGCRIAVVEVKPHSGKSCLRLQSDAVARFGVISNATFQPIPGERFHVSVWVKAEAGTTTANGEPGFVVRILLGKDGTDAPGGHMYLGLNNVVTRKTIPPAAASLPTEWKEMKGEFTFPDDADKFEVSCFSWNNQGTVYYDDLSVEEVSSAPRPSAKP